MRETIWKKLDKIPVWNGGYRISDSKRLGITSEEILHIITKQKVEFISYNSAFNKYFFYIRIRKKKEWFQVTILSGGELLIGEVLSPFTINHLNEYQKYIWKKKKK